MPGTISAPRVPFAHPMPGERIDPLYFGAQERRLFGCHHGPAQGGSQLGVAIAPPLGHEYSRAHRALVQLASLCAAGGMRALRFDWSATGDSQGDDWPSSLETWSADMESAQRELSLRTRVPRSAWVGVRLAGTLLLEASARRAPLAALVLWDPILDTRQYALSLQALQQRFVAGLGSKAANSQSAMPAAAAAAGLECLGFLWPTPLLECLRQWRAPQWTSAPAARVLILESSLSAEAADLAAGLSRGGARVLHERSSGSTPWNEDVDRGLVPLADLRRIVEFLAEDA